VEEGVFREDLFYRLNVLPIRVPQLRERRADIGGLVEVLSEEIAARGGTAPPELSPQAVALLAAQDWRGNIRELRNVLEQAAMRSDTAHIDATQIEAVLRECGVRQVIPPIVTVPPSARSAPLRPLADQVAEVERQAIAAALATTGGNKLATAKLLGISRAKLYERLADMPEIQSMSEIRTRHAVSGSDTLRRAS
jgi:DNA-binding NtrC family response regulator